MSRHEIFAKLALAEIVGADQSPSRRPLSLPDSVILPAPGTAKERGSAIVTDGAPEQLNSLPGRLHIVEG